MDKTEAVAAIGDIESAQQRIRARARYKGADLIYSLWGVIWITAFTFQHFGSGITLRYGPTTIEGGGFIWTPLVLLGIVLTFVIMRRQEAVKDKNAWKFGLLWPIIFGYFYLWMFLLGPMFDYKQIWTEEGMLHGTAVIATIPMCIYVLEGLMSGDAYIGWLGAIVTVFTAIGMFFFHDYFYLWMAVFGGGGLFAAGYISRRKWKTA